MAVKLSCSFVDSYGRPTKRVYGMEDQADLAAYLAVVADFVADIEDVTDLGLVRADLIIPVTGADFDVTAGANVDVGGTFSGFLDTGGGKKSSLKVPGIKSALVNSDGTIPITGVVATYLADFETDGGFNLSDGEQISSWIKGTLDK